MFELDSTIHEEHSINVGIHSDEYKEIYNNMMMLKPCSIMGGLDQPYNQKVSTVTCSAFASSTLGQGMALGLARHYENMRNMYSKYLQIVPNTDGITSNFTSVELTTCLAKVVPNPVGKTYTSLQQKRMCLMEAPGAREIGRPSLI